MPNTTPKKEFWPMPNLSIHCALQYLQKYHPITLPVALKRVKNWVLVISDNADFGNGSAEKLSTMIPKSVCKHVLGNHSNTHASPNFAREVVQFLKQ